MAKIPLLKTLGLDIDVKVDFKDKKAQLLLAAGIFILLIGIAWSFIQGWSVIRVNKAESRKAPIETVEKK